MKRFPKQPNQGGHWVLNYDELREVKHKAGPCDRYESEISLEAVEDVILALRSMGYIEVDSDV